MPQTQIRPVQNSLHLVCDRKSLLDAWATRVRSHSDSMLWLPQAHCFHLQLFAQIVCITYQLWILEVCSQLLGWILWHPFPSKNPSIWKQNMQENGHGLYKSWRISKRPLISLIKLLIKQAVESLSLYVHKFDVFWRAWYVIYCCLLCFLFIHILWVNM